MWEILAAEKLPASEERLCSIEIVIARKPCLVAKTAGPVVPSLDNDATLEHDATSGNSHTASFV
jgi:hypothetical protein